MKKPRILIVEDEAIIAIDLRERLGRFGYEIAGEALTVDEARASITRRPPDIVLLDIMLQGESSGIDIAHELHARAIPVIFITAYADDNTISRAQQSKPFGYIVKPFNDRELVAMIEIALERARYEEHIRESEVRHRSIVEAVFDALFITDMEWKIIEANPAATELYGYAKDELIGRGISSLFLGMNDSPDAALPLSLHRTKSGEVFVAEIVYRAFTWQGKPVNAISVRNVGDRAVSEQALIESSRTSLLTALAAGMTHELIQPITALSFATENLRMLCATEAKEELVRKCDAMAEYILRIKNIVAHARGLTHAWSGEVSFFSVNEAVKGVLDLFGTHYRNRGVMIELALDDAVPRIRGNIYQFEQVIINLLTNAADALDAKNGGVKNIRISTRVERNAAIFTLWDNGCGMPAAVRERLFTPYFTTKSSAHCRGTGIGLWISHAIVTSLNGSISVESAVGEYTQFSITLPCP